ARFTLPRLTEVHFSSHLSASGFLVSLRPVVNRNQRTVSIQPDVNRSDEFSGGQIGVFPFGHGHVLAGVPNPCCEFTLTHVRGESAAFDFTRQLIGHCRTLSCALRSVSPFGLPLLHASILTERAVWQVAFQLFATFIACGRPRCPDQGPTVRIVL